MRIVLERAYSMDGGPSIVYADVMAITCKWTCASGNHNEK